MQSMNETCINMENTSREMEGKVSKHCTKRLTDSAVALGCAEERGSTWATVVLKVPTTRRIWRGRWSGRSTRESKQPEATGSWSEQTSWCAHARYIAFDFDKTSGFPLVPALLVHATCNGDNQSTSSGPACNDVRDFAFQNQPNHHPQTPKVSLAEAANAMLMLLLRINTRNN